MGEREINLRKELAILIALGCEEAVENGGLGVVRVAELIGREKSQVSRALRTLAESGLVDRDPSTLHYRLGWRFFALAARAGEQRLLSVAPPLLERLVKDLGETTHLSVFRGVEVLTVLSKSPPHAVKAVGWSGRTVPVYCTSSGRALLFDHDHDALFELLSGIEFRELAPNTVRNVGELYERVVAARAQGYALVDEEFESGLVGAAAPVRDFRGQIVAALNVSAPKFRLGERLETAGEEVKKAANELSALLGRSSDPQKASAIPSGRPDMHRRSVQFFSARLKLDGDLYLPEELVPGEKCPAIITCSGYQGLKDIHPARFARALVRHGYACLAFDYRGFGNSEGERGRLVPQEQVEDVRSAISFLETVSEVDAQRIALIGWALGGGVAIAAAADDPRVRAVAAINAVGDGERAARSMHDEQSWRELIEQTSTDRWREALWGESQLVHPFKIVRLDDVTRDYVDEQLYGVEGFGSGVTLESADFILRFRPERLVDRIAPRPLLLIHGAENRLHPPEESEELYRLAKEPKELVLLKKTGHTEWAFDEHPTFRRVVNLIREFLHESLDQPKAGSTGRYRYE